MNTQQFVTIPKRMTGNEDLVILSRKVFESLILRQISERDILRWSREAKEMKRKGKLPVLRSLKDLR